MRTRRAGFTLTEILIVLAILGLLSAILLPVLSSSRAQGRRTVCASNLRQIGQAMALYVGDYNGFYPPSLTGLVVDGVIAEEDTLISWRERIATYTKNRSPVCPDVQVTQRQQLWRSDSSSSGYALNIWLNVLVGSSPSQDIAGVRESRIRFPSQTITVLDARAFITNTSEPDAATSPKTLQGSRLRGFDVDILSQTPGALRHSGAANYLFADGHVKWFRPEQISTAQKNDGTTPGFGL